jgi:outer membrane immunogenic protein
MHMKTLIAAASAAALVSLAPGLAQAQTATTGLYGNLGYANANVDDFNFGGIQGRLGWRMNDWFGVEGELALGINEESVSIPTTQGPARVDLKVKHAEAVYGVGFIPIGQNTDLLARIGYGNTEIEGSVAGFSASQDGGSWNFGVGAQHHFDGVNGVRVDYTRQEFTGDDGGSADVWSITYSRRF